MRLRSSETLSRFGGPRQRKLVWAAAVVVWCGSVALGVGALQRYKSSPAAAPEPPPVWPTQSRLTLSHDKPTLVLVAHPRCPCTRATLHEFAAIMSRAGERVAAHLIFVKPRGVQQDWEKGELWQSAQAIPGVTLTVDEGGKQASLFRSTTSGQVLLFDTAGKRVFAGGITGSRGHEGDNPGRSRVLALITQGKAESPKSPVFGCELDDPKYLPAGAVALGQPASDKAKP